MKWAVEGSKLSSYAVKDIIIDLKTIHDQDNAEIPKSESVVLNIAKKDTDSREHAFKTQEENKLSVPNMEPSYSCAQILALDKKEERSPERAQRSVLMNKSKEEDSRMCSKVREDGKDRVDTNLEHNSEPRKGTMRNET